MINFIIHTFKRFAWFKRLNAKVTYELLASKIPASEWQFMNYGYVPLPNEATDLDLKDYAQRHPLQMYHYLAAKGNLQGKNVLEVGSGRGGGARHVASYFKPAQYTGLDLASSAVKLCNELHKLPNLRFVQGSAESLPVADASVDVVMNVESSHAYGSVTQFLSEVKRVLKPGGHFLMVDFRSNENIETIETLKQQLRDTGLQVISEEDITANVIQSIEEEDGAKKARIAQLVPPKWHKLFGDFAGVVGSRFYNTLKNGSRQYYRFVLQKPL